MEDQTASLWDTVDNIPVWEIVRPSSCCKQRRLDVSIVELALLKDGILIWEMFIVEGYYKLNKLQSSHW